MKYAKKILLNLLEPLRSNQDLLLLAIEYSILSYIDIYRSHLKYQNDIEFLIRAIFRQSSVYLELCQLPNKAHWYESTTSIIPSAPTNVCGSVACNIGIDSGMNHDCHKIAYATITSSTSEATVIGKVLENIPTFLMTSEYNDNALVHTAIVDRANIAYVHAHVKEKFPYLCSNVDSMIRAIQRDCDLFVACTEKDDPRILIAAMNAITAYPLIRTKSVDYILEHLDDVLLHTIQVSKTYDMLGLFVPDDVWNENINLQKAWIKRKGSLLPCTIQFLNEYSTNDIDNHKNIVIRDLALYIAEYNSEHFFHVPSLLKSNFNFMLKAIELSSGLVIKFECINETKQKMECVVHAIAHYPKDGKVIQSICDYTPQQICNHIQMSLTYHDTFVNPILCTIYQTRDGRSDTSESKNNDTTASPIEILNCGNETSTALLQRIALFAGVPIGATYKIYEKANMIMYHYLNPPKPSPSTLYTTNGTPVDTIQGANGNIQPPRPATDAAARVPNAADFLNVTTRLQFEQLRRAARIRHVHGGENIPIFDEIEHNVDGIFPFDDDDNDDDIELEENVFMDDFFRFDVQLDQIPADVVAAGDAGPIPNLQLPPPDDEPINDINRFILANMGEHIGHPPQMNNRFLVPDLPFDPFDMEHDRAILRTMRRRRLRNDGGHEEEDMYMRRMLLLRRHLRPPAP